MTSNKSNDSSWTPEEIEALGRFPIDMEHPPIPDHPPPPFEVAWPGYKCIYCNAVDVMYVWNGGPSTSALCNSCRRAWEVGL